MSTKPKPASGMWLYPISQDSGYYFEMGSESTDDTSFESFQRMIAGGGADDRWGITANRRRVQLGDELIIYASGIGRSPPLLVGFGQINDPPDLELKKGWQIGIEWDLEVTNALCKSPIDATFLKERLPVTKGAVVTLSPEEARWVRERLPARSR